MTPSEAPPSFANALSSFAEGAPAAVYAIGEEGRPRLAAASQPFAPERLDVDDPALVALRAEPRPIEPEAVGSRLPAALIAPMVNRNEVVGLALLGLKPSGLGYRPDETELIGWATRQVGLDLHALKVEQLEAEKARQGEEIARLNAKLEGVLAARTA